MEIATTIEGESFALFEKPQEKMQSQKPERKRTSILLNKKTPPKILPPVSQGYMYRPVPKENVRYVVDS
jgi:hypothetical protein